MVNSVFTLKIGGSAGQGIKSAGLMFAKVATRSGYNICDFTEYPSLIRGGHNVMQISFSQEEITSSVKKIDLLVALNQETVNRHLEELSSGSGILFDDQSGIDASKAQKEINLYPVPLAKIAEEAGNKDLLINTVALGAAMGLLGGNLNFLKDLIKEEYGDKGEKILGINYQAAQKGYDWVLKQFGASLQKRLTETTKVEGKMIVNGNEAIALGAIAAGLQFAAIYPMTPTSNILHVLALYQEKYGFIYKQPEDELAAVNMAIGASFAGARSMTATSGGGFCLMTEGYGLAGMTETPLVIIEGMRPGPATGLPTWSEQGDLRFVLSAHQGDFPRLVLAPGDAKEAFEMTIEAFDLADKYQTPVIVLVDKNLCENDQSFPLFDISSYQISRGKYSTKQIADYQRYALSEDGISERTVPGTGNHFVANSDEHDPKGFSSEEIKDRTEQMQKRMAKLKTCASQNMPKPVLFGPENAGVTIVSWGSNKGSILQAMKEFKNVNYLHLAWMNPFPKEAVKEILSKAKHVIDIEYNYTAQLAGLIREQTGIEITDKLLKYDGRMFFPEEIIEKIKSVLDEHS